MLEEELCIIFDIQVLTNCVICVNHRGSSLVRDVRHALIVMLAVFFYSCFALRQGIYVAVTTEIS